MIIYDDLLTLIRHPNSLDDTHTNNHRFAKRLGPFWLSSRVPVSVKTIMTLAMNAWRLVDLTRQRFFFLLFLNRSEPVLDAWPNTEMYNCQFSQHCKQITIFLFLFFSPMHFLGLIYQAVCSAAIVSIHCLDSHHLL